MADTEQQYRQYISYDEYNIANPRPTSLITTDMYKQRLKDTKKEMSGAVEQAGEEYGQWQDTQRFYAKKEKDVEDITLALEGKSPAEKLDVLTASLNDNNDKKAPEEQNVEYISDPANARQEAIMQVYADTIRGFRDLRPDIVAALYTRTYKEYLGNSLTNGRNVEDFADGGRPTILSRDMPGQLFVALERAAMDLAESNNPNLSSIFNYQYFEAIKATVLSSFSGEKPEPNERRFGSRYFQPISQGGAFIDVASLENRLYDNSISYGYFDTDEQTQRFLEESQRIADRNRPKE